MHPFNALIKRYCIDYTNSQDVSLLPDLMTDEYVVHISGHDLRVGSTYKAGVESLFANAPGLNMTVHQLYCNGDRLALRFSEHASFLDKANARATWRGYGTYKWDGSRLVECWVEQDFYSRYRQIKSGKPYSPQPPAIDAWMTPIVPEDATVLTTARRWLEGFDLAEVGSAQFDDAADCLDWILPIDPEQVTISDIFSCGSSVPFHARITGALTMVPDKVVTMSMCGVITVGPDGKIDRVEGVFDRFSSLIAERE